MTAVVALEDCPHLAELCGALPEGVDWTEQLMVEHLLAGNVVGAAGIPPSEEQLARYRECLRDDVERVGTLMQSLPANTPVVEGFEALIRTIEGARIVLELTESTLVEAAHELSLREAEHLEEGAAKMSGERGERLLEQAQNHRKDARSLAELSALLARREARRQASLDN